MIPNFVLKRKNIMFQPDKQHCRDDWGTANHYMGDEDSLKRTGTKRTGCEHELHA